jgi:hypothetical protein
LAAEIRSFLELLEQEKIVQFLSETLERIKQENRLPLIPVSFRTTYSTVFCGSTSKLGYLNACLLDKIVSYYYKVQRLVEYGDVLCANLTDIHDRHAEKNPEEIQEQVMMLEEMKTVATEIRETAIKLVNQLAPPRS